MFVVLDQEDALAADGGRRTFWPSHRGDHGSDHTRQEDAHGGAAADGARHADDAAGLMHEAVHHAEAQSRAVARPLGREERLEGLLHGLGTHARAVVGELDQNMVAHRPVVATGRNVAHRDPEFAAIRHGIAGIVGQIDDAAIELCAIDLDLPETRGGFEFDRDPLADRALEQLHDLADPVARIGEFGIERLAAREGKQAARQLRAAHRAADRAVDQLRHFGIDVRAVRQHVEIAHDDREIVVEIVRQPAGQPADRIHALGFAQLLLDLQPLGDVDNESLDGHHLPAWRIDALAPLQDRTPRSVGMVHPVFAFAGQVRGDLGIASPPNPLIVVGMHQPAIDDAASSEVGGRDAEQRTTALAHEFHRPVPVVAAAIGDAGQIAEKRDVTARGFAQLVRALDDQTVEVRVQFAQLALAGPGSWSRRHCRAGRCSRARHRSSRSRCRCRPGRYVDNGR